MGGLVGAVTSPAAAVCLSVTYKRAYHRPTGGTLPHSETFTVSPPYRHNGIRNHEFSRNPGLTLQTVEGRSTHTHTHTHRLFL
ncbi:hypothetical protein JOQ06_010597 [Pogonophryne albipinna]|uniref:Uncharacterized protein n=1 Tax=Pogonophryne albipinna TaxID=1090488 RepID=A0AAD6FEI5_9TELE|nr:hypothetical protein JOQ06_010597 [Pogonophryne albipinna]